MNAPMQDMTGTRAAQPSEQVAQKVADLVAQIKAIDSHPEVVGALASVAIVALVAECVEDLRLDRLRIADALGTACLYAKIGAGDLNLPETMPQD
ncbi:MAG: hypothetical protein ACK4TB_02985 [Gemmobacter sp.]